MGVNTSIHCDEHVFSAAVQISPGPKDEARLIDEGGMDDTYQFLQLHFHWGADSKRGSEHLIDGKKFPLEVRNGIFAVQKIVCLIRWVIYGNQRWNINSTFTNINDNHIYYLFSIDSFYASYKRRILSSYVSREFSWITDELHVYLINIDGFLAMSLKDNMKILVWVHANILSEKS